MRVSTTSCPGDKGAVVVNANDSSGAGNIAEERFWGKVIADVTVFSRVLDILPCPLN